MDRLLAGSIAQLERTMNYRLERQGALASNVANADTPGYRRRDVAFQDAMEKATAIARTDPRHLGGLHAGLRVTTGPRGARPDGNGVDRDQETLELSRNAGAFSDAANLLSRLFALARVAVTGESR